MAITEADVHASLRALIDPNTGRDFVSDKAVQQGAGRRRRMSPSTSCSAIPAKSQHETLRQLVPAPSRGAAGRRQRRGDASASKIVSHAVQRGVKLVPGVKNIIAVASGKGGVGKSTTAVNLALALAAEGATVGVLDADIYGPSQPMMLGIAGRPESKDGKTLEPLEAYGVQAMSIGFLIDTDTPMVWRGPMVTQALEQLLKDTNWRELDYLIVDMPPGTGDIQLTLSQKVPVTGAVIVTTPQDIALIDARKGLKMFEKVGVPIVGIVENMTHPRLLELRPRRAHLRRGRRAEDVRRLQRAVPRSLPLDIRIREQADSGRPTVVADPDGAVAAIYSDIARKVAVFVAQKAEDFSRRSFRSIVDRRTPDCRRATAGPAMIKSDSGSAAWRRSTG